MQNEEINDLYDTGYKIIQNPKYFKLSLDSLLLSNFVKINLSDKILLDLCTGNAPIPILLSKKINNIYGIELQKEIYELAKKSLEINNLKNIELINDNVKNLQNYFKPNSIDIITCNPPYFKYNSKSIINDNEIKTIARHEKEITLEEIIKNSSIILRHLGRLYLVHRTDRLIEIINLLNKYNFGIKTMQFCYNTINHDCKMVLIESQKNGKNDLKVINPLITELYGGKR